MVAMGGAGPLHAARVARKLGVREVVVPPASGAASALGFLVAPVAYELARSWPMRIASPDFAAVEELLGELEAEGRLRLAEAGVGGGNSKAGAVTNDATGGDPGAVGSGREPAPGICPEAGAQGSVTVQRQADMRLRGQMHEISVPLPAEPLSPENLPVVIEAFTAEYQRRYTHLYDGAEIEVLNWRVVCTGPAADLSGGLAGSGDDDRGRDRSEGPNGALKGLRRAWAPGRGDFADVPVYDRYAMETGSVVEGPAIVEEREATTIVPDACSLTVDEGMNLRLSLAETVPSRIVVGADTALEEAVARIEADPVGLEIMWSRMINIAEECWQTVIRTAFSLIIGEAQDFACEILDAGGRQIVHSPRAMPVFNLTLPIAVNAMIERYPPETLKPGDVLVTNDPWLCAGHLFDIAIAVPVFRKGEVVAFCGVVGHVSDIGGTKDSLHAREIYEEGFQIPPMKLFRAGEPNEDLFTLLAENVRRPDQVLGDVHALVASGLTGAERIGEFMEEYGMHDLEALAAVVQKRAEAAMRRAIASLPDGRYEHRVEADGLDTHMSFPIQIRIEGDEIEVGFDGAPPQMDQGGSNCTLTYTKAHATYPLKCILSPEVPGNAGCYRPMKVTAPEKSIMNCDRPLAVNMRTRTGWYIAPNVFGALAKAAAGRVQAFTGLPSSALFYGIGPAGIFYSDHLFQGGGQGAYEHGDGHSALLYPTSAGNTSVELFETRVPALVIEKAFMADSGGAGRRRGGLGQVISARKLENDGEAVPGRALSHGGAAASAGTLRRPAGRALGWLRWPVRRRDARCRGRRAVGHEDDGGVRRAARRRRIRIRRPPGASHRCRAAGPRRGLRHRGGRAARLRLRRRSGRRDRPRREQSPPRRTAARCRRRTRRPRPWRRRPSRSRCRRRGPSKRTEPAWRPDPTRPGAAWEDARETRYRRASAGCDGGSGCRHGRWPVLRVESGPRLMPARYALLIRPQRGRNKPWGRRSAAEPLKE